MNILSTQKKKNKKKNVLKQIAPRANKIVRQYFLKVVVGNRSRKEAMISSFCRAHCSKFSISAKSAKMKWLSKLLMKFISKTFSKK